MTHFITLTDHAKQRALQRFWISEERLREMADPSPEDLRDDELWYTFDDKVERSEINWPRECIGHYHPAQGDNTQLFHKYFDVSYIVPLTMRQFKDLISQ